MATHHAHDTRVAYGVPGYSTRVRGECRFSPVQVFASAGFRLSLWPKAFGKRLAALATEARAARLCVR